MIDSKKVRKFASRALNIIIICLNVLYLIFMMIILGIVFLVKWLWYRHNLASYMEMYGVPRDVRKYIMSFNK